jgi:protein O-mannosyl-transferase
MSIKRISQPERPHPEGQSRVVLPRAETPCKAPAHLWPLLVLAAITVALYANSLSGGFVWDDRSLILQNPLVQTPQRAFEAFIHRLFLFTREFDYYRPWVILSFSLDQWLWNGRAFGFHLTNVLLHLGGVIGLYLLLQRLWGRRAAVLSSGLFASFACHTENVASIAGRMDVLSTLFMLLGLLVYFWRSAGRVGPISLVLCFLFELGALLSKELGALFPILFGLCVFHLHPRKEWKGHFLGGVLFIGAAFVAYAVLRIITTGGLRSQVVAVYPFRERILILPGLMLLYLQLLVFPFNLNARHITPPPAGLASPGFFGPLVLLALLTVGVTLLARRSRPMAFGGLWFLSALLPVLNLLPLEGTTMADRFLYLPSAGFALLLVSLPGIVKKSKDRFGNLVYRGVWAILILIGLNNAVFTVLRNPVWHDEMRFFSLLVKQDPTSCIAHHNLGYAYYREGNWVRAEAEYRQAIALNPAYAESHATLGDLLYKTGRYAEAILEYEAYLELFPDAPNREKTLERIRKLRSLVSFSEKGER